MAGVSWFGGESPSHTLGYFAVSHTVVPFLDGQDHGLVANSQPSITAVLDDAERDAAFLGKLYHICRRPTLCKTGVYVDDDVLCRVESVFMCHRAA